MLESMLDVISTNDLQKAGSVIKRDNDVDRHYFVIERLNHLAIDNPSYIWDNNLNLNDVLNFNVAAKFIERIGDHIAGFMYDYLEDQRLDENVKPLLITVTKFYEKIYHVFFSKELKDVGSVFEERYKLEEDLNSIKANIESKMQIFHIRRILRYCIDLGQIAIFQSLGKLIKGSGN
jgi:phosphate uptake regulator